jgi:arsenate reductase (glutaredoxin)
VAPVRGRACGARHVIRRPGSGGVLEPSLTVYEKPTCSKCRELFVLLTERGVDFERVNFHLEPLAEERIAELLAKAGLSPAEAVRTKEPVYAQLAIGERSLSDGELIALMAEHPELLQRPIVERGDRAVLARPAERVLELLD